MRFASRHPDVSVSLRDYFEGLRDADHEALRLAKVEIDRRLDGMNELREQIASERGHYLDITTHTLRHEELERRLTSLELWRANLTGRTIVFSIIGAMMVATTAAFVTHLFGG